MTKFDFVCDCRLLLNDVIIRATDVPSGGTRALVGGYGDVGKVLVHPPRFCCTRCSSPTVTPFSSTCRLSWRASGWRPLRASCLRLPPTGNNEVFGSIGLTDNEIFLSGLQALEGHGMVVLVSRWARHFNLGCAQPWSLPS